MTSTADTTIAGRDVNSREGRILATARDLLPERLSGVWDRGYIDPAYIADIPVSAGERAIVRALEEVWRCLGTFGELVELPPADRSALVALLDPTHFDRARERIARRAVGCDDSLRDIGRGMERTR